jgi:methylmalonyl-CoA mutase cobalamin-binding subunit
MHDSTDTDTDTPDVSTIAPLTTSERTAIDGLLRWQLGRRMTICLLALADTYPGEVAALAERLTSIDEVRVMPPVPSAEEGLRQAAQTDAEVALVWLSAEDERELAAATGLLERAEALGLRDRSFLALIGPHVTRDLAHRLLFEEGYPATTPTAQLLWSLAQEAIARDELRRRGSSPPCYL